MGRPNVKRVRSRLTSADLRAKLLALGLSQRKFSQIASLPRVSVVRACHAPGFITIDIARGLRLCEVIVGLRAIVNDRTRRPGWRKLKAILEAADKPIAFQKRQRGKTGATYRLKPKFKPPTTAGSPPRLPEAQPTRDHPAGPAPRGYYWQMRGYTWTLQPIAPERHGSF
jgi:hypothetical protein